MATQTINKFIVRVSLLGATISSLICARSQDMKLLVAYSSVAHIGFFLVSAFTSTAIRYSARTVMIISHGLSSSLLFSLTFKTYEITSSRRLLVSKGAGLVFPFLSLWWFIGSLGNMGTPPTFNFVGEVLILIRSLSAVPARFIFFGPAMFLSAAYSLVLFTSLCHGGGDGVVSQYRNRFNLVGLLHLAPLFSLFLIRVIFS